MVEMGAVGNAQADYFDFLDISAGELDEKEFDLPTVEAQSLESILNESETEIELLPEGDITSDLLSIGSHKKDAPFNNGISNADQKKRNFFFDGHGPVMKHLSLGKIAAQLKSAQDRVNAGAATAICVDKQLAVGTSRGLVLTFDTKQVLRWCLGSATMGAQYGAVSAISFSVDGTRLLVGFARGQIVMWDLSDGSLLRTIMDAHPPGSAVLHIKFTDSHALALCSDSSGSVYELEFTRLMGIRGCTSRCLFAGSRGEVCCIEPLHMPPGLKERSLEAKSLTALATWTKVWLVSIRPELCVLDIQPLTGSPDSLPLLAWQFVYVESASESSTLSPVLACARESTVYFYMVVCKSPKDVQLSQIRCREVSFKMTGLMWVNSQIIALLDTAERVHVLDIRSWEELECTDLSHIQLIYSTSFFKSLATGGNVSPALAFAANHACYQSIGSFRRQLFFLGTKFLAAMSVRHWDERIDVLTAENKFKDALALAYTFYSGTAKAVLGLSAELEERKSIVASKMMDILYKYVDSSMTKFCPASGKIEELVKYYETVVPVCVDCCLLLDRIDVLFGKLYERFGEDVIAHGTFLERLEPYILEGRLRTMSPLIIKDLAAHFNDRGMLHRVEACIVRLDIISLDIHETVKLCWENSMYDAFVYVYNQGLRDYITPLHKLLAVLQGSLKSGKQLSDAQVKIGHQLLVYISCCLAGAAYPSSGLRIPDELVDSVRQEVFKCITCLHSNNASPDELIYPHLRTLLQFDTKEFLNVLALAFEEAEFSTGDGALQKQRVVDILLQVMVESSSFTVQPNKIGCLFTFLARQMARHGSTVKVNRLLCDQVLEYLCQLGDEATKDERQEAILELLAAGSGGGGGVTATTSYDEATLLVMAEGGELYRVCEHLYKEQGLYDKMLECFLKDKARRHQAFAFAESVVTSSSIKSEMRERVKNVALCHIEDLIMCDNEKAARLVAKVLAEDIKTAVMRVAKNPSLQYQLLIGIMAYSESQGSGQSDSAGSGGAIDPAVVELYLDRMCLLESKKVEAYLKSPSGGYRVPEALEICRKYQIFDATSYLLEKSGDVQGAFRLTLERLKEDLQKQVDRCCTGKASMDASTAGAELMLIKSQAQMALIKAVELCQRHSSKMGEKERVDLWFPLLDTVMAAPRRAGLPAASVERLSEIFKDLSKHVLNSMMGYIPLPALMNKIDSLFTLGSGKFGDVKDVLLGMLSTYDYEKTLMSTCNSMLNHDLYEKRATLRIEASKAITPKTLSCAHCHVSVASSSSSLPSANDEELLVFSCGNIYHATCLERCGSYAGSMKARDAGEDLPSREDANCPHCNPSSVTSALRRQPRRSESADVAGESGQRPEYSVSGAAIGRGDHVSSKSRAITHREEIVSKKLRGSTHRDDVFRDERLALKLIPRYPLNNGLLDNV